MTTRKMAGRIEVETLDGPRDVAYSWEDELEVDDLPFGSTTARREEWIMIDDSERFTIDGVTCDEDDLAAELPGVDVEDMIATLTDRANEV